jgi:hypothetical protein
MPSTKSVRYVIRSTVLAHFLENIKGIPRILGIPVLEKPRCLFSARFVLNVSECLPYKALVTLLRSRPKRQQRCFLILFL